MTFPKSKTLITYLVFLLVFLCLLQACSDFGNTVDYDDNPSRITTDAMPDWSPDGRWIVYRHEDDFLIDTTYPSGIYIVDSAGNNKTLLIQGETFSPAWSPDGRYIAFSAGAIYVYEVSTSNTARLTNFGGHFPRWSPDGSKIVCGRSGPQDTVGIWIIEMSSGLATRFGYGGQPDWSPDGLEFITAGAVTPYLTGISRVVIADHTTTILTSTGEDQRGPRWSPDGQKIVWHAILSAWDFHIRLMNRDGSGQRKLTNGIDPTWSPDGQTIVFSTFDPSQTKFVLWTIDVNGQRKRQLTR